MIILLRLSLLIVISNLCLSDNSFSKKLFTISEIKDQTTEILFENPDIKIINNSGLSEFKTDDMIGVTMEEGFPQLPIYSSLFQMTPGILYDVEYEIISSYFIEDIEIKTFLSDDKTDNTKIYPSNNISLSDNAYIYRISYKLPYVLLSGISIRLYDITIKEQNDSYKINIQNKDSIQLMNTIDSYFNQLDGYDSFIKSNTLHFRKGPTINRIILKYMNKKKM